MLRTLSRRDVVSAAYGIGAALGAAGLAPTAALARVPGAEPTEDMFFRDDWFGEPWRTPAPAVLIHGADESSIVWYRGCRAWHENSV